MQLVDKYILLTGASGGIGKAIARELDSRGARLLLVGRNNEKLQNVLQGLSGEHSTLVADLNEAKSREAITFHCQQSSVDIVINCAGTINFGLFENQNTDSTIDLLNSNLLSPMLLIQQLIPLLKARPEAAVVCIGSIFGSIGHPGFVSYCASKFGLRGFTEALQRELADTAIKVIYLAPRATDTDFNNDQLTALNKDLGNAVDNPELVAEVLVDALSNIKNQVYMGWPERFFVKLNGLLPNIVHSALVKKLEIVKRYANQ